MVYLLCVFSCVFVSVPFCVKAFTTLITSVWFISCVCSHVYFASFLFCVKHLPHSPHLYGLSPVCVLMCICNFRILVQNIFTTLITTIHLYGLSPVCLLMCVCICLFKDHSLAKTLYHTHHICMVYHLCVFSYVFVTLQFSILWKTFTTLITTVLLYLQCGLLICLFKDELWLKHLPHWSHI